MNSQTLLETHIKNILMDTLIQDQELDKFRIRVNELKSDPGILHLILLAQSKQGKMEHVSVVLDVLGVPDENLRLKERLTIYLLGV